MAFTDLSNIARDLGSPPGGRLTPPPSQSHHGATRIHTLSSTNTNSSSEVSVRQLSSLKITLLLLALVIRSPITPLSWAFDGSVALLIADSLLVGAALLATAYIHLCVASLTTPIEVDLVPGVAAIKWFLRRSSKKTIEIRDGRILPSSTRNGVVGGIGEGWEDDGDGGDGRWLDRTFTWRPRRYYWPCAGFETVLITFALFNGDAVFRRCVAVAVVAGTWYVGLEAAGRGRDGLGDGSDRVWVRAKNIMTRVLRKDNRKHLNLVWHRIYTTHPMESHCTLLTSNLNTTLLIFCYHLRLLLAPFLVQVLVLAFFRQQRHVFVGYRALRTSKSTEKLMIETKVLTQLVNLDTQDTQTGLKAKNVSGPQVVVY
ncbi:hypothetical protein MFIFM68171_09624 [Madurella fahalii]|uniref:Uncharacterized protein n=1 Tax=Madurella fahalii TaxID=1157608 RepID=A0ABQ0GNW3_9PEZI